MRVYYTGHGWGTSSRAHVRTCKCVPFPYPEHGRTDYAEIWSVVKEPLARRFTKRLTKVNGRAQLHVRTPSPHLGNRWTDCAEIWCVVRRPLARHFTAITSGANACASPFHILVIT